MPAEEIAKQFIENLDTDDAVDIIQELDEEDRDKILSHIDDVEQAGDIIDLLKYDEDTAGGLMGTEMIVVNENWVDARMHQADEDAGRGYGRDLQRLCGRQRLPPAGHTAAENADHPPVGVEDTPRHGGEPGIGEDRHPDRRGGPRLSRNTTSWPCRWSTPSDAS